MIFNFSMCLLLTACGSKGDLYQVKEPDAVKKTSAKSTYQNFQKNTKQQSQPSTTELKKKQS